MQVRITLLSTMNMLKPGSNKHLKSSSEGIYGGSIQVVAGFIQKQQVARYKGKSSQGHSSLFAPTQVPCRSLHAQPEFVRAELKFERPEVLTMSAVAQCQQRSSTS